ncbi:MAG: GNAT family N-acetyltransferase [Bdellovibrionales bacterium]|nr:GNAT family N-acetyltransferase [Bdellovibrionales bacterium]
MLPTQSGTLLEVEQSSPDTLSITTLAEADFRQEALDAFTFPAYRHLVQAALSDSAQAVGLVAFSGDIPMGLLLAEQTQSHCSLRSVYVPPASRRQGIGSRLLERWEETSVRLGITCLETSYTSSLPAVAAFEALLRRAQWEEPTERYLFVRGIVKKVWENAEFIKRLDRIAPGFSTFSWQELTADERSELESRIAAGGAPDNLSPFYDEEHIEPISSTGLRYGSRIVGWQINHWLPNEPGVLRYTRTYVEPKHQRLGRAIMMLRDAIRRHYNSALLDQYPYFVCDVAREMSAMQQFYQKHLIPYAEKSYRSYYCSKELASCS